MKKAISCVLVLSLLTVVVVSGGSRDAGSSGGGFPGHRRHHPSHYAWMSDSIGDEGPIVHLAGLGSLRGVQTSKNVFSFLGVPYASPPLRRWMPPGEAHGWEGIRQADQSGPDCPRKAGKAEGPRRRQDEDCLYLDVHLPYTETAGKIENSAFKKNKKYIVFPSIQNSWSWVFGSMGNNSFNLLSILFANHKLRSSKAKDYHDTK